MHIHLHMQMNMSISYKPEFKELGLSPKYNTIKAHPGKNKDAPTQIYQPTCARSFL